MHSLARFDWFNVTAVSFQENTEPADVVDSSSAKEHTLTVHS